MEIDGFKIKEFNKHGLNPNAKKSICPLCSQHRKKKKDTCASLNWEKGIGKCHHCGESFQLHEYHKKDIKPEPTYEKPRLDLLRDLTDEHRNYLNGRGITDQVINSEDLRTSFEFLIFPYYKNNEIVNTKQRDNSKSFRQSKNCRQTMYRLDAISKSIEEQKAKGQEIKIVVCEGEFDALSWVVANCDYATSVSQGAPGLKDKSVTSKLACIYNDLSILVQANIIYLSCDTDEPGQKLRDELTRIFQQHCKVKIIDHGNYKDANEILIEEGVKGLHKVFKEAKDAEKLTIELSEPEPVEEIKPIFPIDVFPEFVQELFSHYRSVKNYENSFMGISLMAVIGTVAGSKQLFDSGQYDNRCLFMSTMVAPPSTNKSGPMRDMLKPLEFINSQMRAENKSEQEQFEFNEEKADKDPTKEKMAKPSWRQLVFENATVEAVHRMHETNEHGLCCKADELRSWFDSLGQYKSSGKGADLGFYLANFNGDSYTINRVKEAMHIDLLHINIVGGIQPDKLASFPTDNGFLQRFIFALPENEPKLRPRLRINKELISTYNDYIVSAYFNFSNAESETTYELTESASGIFYDYLDAIRLAEIDKDTSIIFAQFLGKITIIFHRLCLMFRLMDSVFDVMPEGSGFFIGTDHVEAAIKLTEYFIGTSKIVTSDKDHIKELQRVAYGRGETGKQMITRLMELGFPKKDIERISGKSRQYVHKVISEQFVKQGGKK